MKKIVVAGASLVLATLPVVGAFAATGTTVTDTVAVTINTACSITSTNASNTYSDTMTNGQLKSDFGSTSMSISCNNVGGWSLKAKGSGGATDKTKMKATGSGTDIVTGVATSGDVSNWAMKVTGDSATGFTTFKAVPANDTTVATSDGASSGTTVTTTYQVWISATQQADTYTGQVTYTLVNPAS